MSVIQILVLSCYKELPSSRGEILGGCLESLYDIFDNSRYADSTELCQKYKLFPDLSDWEGKILLLETSEEKPEPEDFKKMLRTLKDTGIFTVISGLLVGKPMDKLSMTTIKRHYWILLTAISRLSII